MLFNNIPLRFLGRSRGKVSLTTFPLNFRQVEEKREQRTWLCSPSLEFYTLSDVRRQGSSDELFEILLNCQAWLWNPVCWFSLLDMLWSFFKLLFHFSIKYFNPRNIVMSICSMPGAFINATVLHSKWHCTHYAIFIKKKVGIQAVLERNYNILVFLFLLLFLSCYKSLHWEILCEIRKERGERTIEIPSFSSGF